MERDGQERMRSQGCFLGHIVDQERVISFIEARGKHSEQCFAR
jgi:hypothetical protein